MLQRKPRIGKSKIKKLIEFFIADVNATTASKLIKVNRNTVNLWYNNFREKIEEKEEEVQKTKYLYLKLRREKMEEYILKSSKMPQNKSFCP